MSKKNKPDNNGFVFSTNPNFKFEEDEQALQTLPNNQQKLRVWLDTKKRGGKVATLITGFVGTIDDLEELGKKLKNFCGTGGSAKDNEMIVQGDQREKVLQWLLKNGYTNTKKAG
ncbi:MAG: translation initiation factor [Chitinophagaceae bacterium]|jgi:translation initiation factor 1|nr:translation initiation factor [Chitinophagaceae bacterium]